MNIALVSGLIILILLVIMLVAGVPIAVALGISSVVAILPIMDLEVAVVTGAQRIFSGISMFSLLAIRAPAEAFCRHELQLTAGNPVLYPGRQYYE